MSDHGGLEDDGTELAVIATDGVVDTYYFSDGVCIYYRGGEEWDTDESRKADGTTFDANRLAEFAAEDGYSIWKRSDSHSDEPWLDLGKTIKQGKSGRPDGVGSVDPSPFQNHVNVTAESGSFADSRSKITNTTLEGDSEIVGAKSKVAGSVFVNRSSVMDVTVEDSQLDNTDVKEGAVVRRCKLVDHSVDAGITIEDVDDEEV
jgi:hypothetical protein